jgi:hypothetical protein
VAVRAEAARAELPEADVAVTGVLRQVLAFHRSLVGTLASLAPRWRCGGLQPPPPAAEWQGAGAELADRRAARRHGLARLARPATVMVASIVLGLAVDDIHTSPTIARRRAAGAHAAVAPDRAHGAGHS